MILQRGLLLCMVCSFCAQMFGEEVIPTHWEDFEKKKSIPVSQTMEFQFYLSDENGNLCLFFEEEGVLTSYEFRGDTLVPIELQFQFLNGEEDISKRVIEDKVKNDLLRDVRYLRSVCDTTIVYSDSLINNTKLRPILVYTNTIKTKLMCYVYFYEKSNGNIHLGFSNMLGHNLLLWITDDSSASISGIDLKEGLLKTVFLCDFEILDIEYIGNIDFSFLYRLQCELDKPKYLVLDENFEAIILDSLDLVIQYKILFSDFKVLYDTDTSVSYYPFFYDMFLLAVSKNTVELLGKNYEER